MDWEAQDEGFLAKIILPAGSKDIPVGTPVAVVVEDAEHVISNSLQTLSALINLHACVYPITSSRSSCSLICLS